LSVWGPPELAPDQPSGTADITNQLTTVFATNTHIRRDLVEHLPGGGITFQTNEITNEGVVYQNNGVTGTAFLVDHGVVKPAYGYRVDYQGLGGFLWGHDMHSQPGEECSGSGCSGA
jgi:hypothetical protein